MVKTHQPTPNVSALNCKHWLFLTAYSKSAAGSPTGCVDWQSIAQAETVRLGSPVKYAQVASLLARRGYYLAMDYQPIFGLSDEQMEALLHYLRFWTILRQCCGSQMAVDYHAALTKRQYHVEHFSRSSPMYHACETYNLDAVESALMHTQVHQRFARYSHRIRSLSSSDSAFNGSYCSTVNARIQHDNLSLYTKIS